MSVEDGAEWNFCYVLPGGDPKDPELVVPQALQIWDGWALSCFKPFKKCDEYLNFCNVNCPSLSLFAAAAYPTARRQA